MGWFARARQGWADSLPFVRSTVQLQAAGVIAMEADQSGDAVSPPLANTGGLS